MIKKRIKKIAIIIVMLIPIIIIASFIVVPIINDIKAEQLTDSLKKELLPEETILIEAISGCGNTTGTSNHAETWAGMLIKTELTEEQIYEFYGKANVQKVDETNQTTSILRLLGRHFKYLNNISEYEGYYIVERVGEAISAFELRGH